MSADPVRDVVVHYKVVRPMPTGAVSEEWMVLYEGNLPQSEIDKLTSVFESMDMTYTIADIQGERLRRIR